jgi:hypothetical protein
MSPQELAGFNAIAAELESAKHDGLLGNGVFLHTMFQEMRAPEYQLDIAPYENELRQSTTIGSGLPEDDRRWAMESADF